MANLQLIRDIAEKKNITLRMLATRVGISEDGLQKLITNGSTKTSTLETIARELEVPVGVFFEGCQPFVNHLITNGNGSATSIYGNATAGVIADKDKEIEHLKQLLEEKDKIITEKERTIQILINK